MTGAKPFVPAFGLIVPLAAVIVAAPIVVSLASSDPGVEKRHYEEAQYEVCHNEYILALQTGTGYNGRECYARFDRNLCAIAHARPNGYGYLPPDCERPR